MRLIHGECLAEMDKLILEGVKVDAIICDPPYGTTVCKWDSVIPFDAMWNRLNKLIKPNGAIVLFGSEPFSSALRMSNIKMYKYDWIWKKNRASNIFNLKTMPKKIYEVISIFYSNQPTYNYQLIPFKKDTMRESKWCKSAVVNKGEFYDGNVEKNHGSCIEKKGAYPENILEYRLEQNNQFKKFSFHPTQKPVALMEYLIKTYTNKDETVLDFTMGSGTTGVACKQLDRHFIGIELDDKYFDIAEQRIKNHIVQETI